MQLLYVVLVDDSPMFRPCIANR